MTEEKQRIAIADALGLDVMGGGHLSMSGSGVYLLVRKRGKMQLTDWRSQGDWLNDLNAMHEAEKSLSDKKRPFFVHVLHCLEQGDVILDEEYFSPSQYFERPYFETFGLVHATAAQRAEAFLRALNLWEEA